MQTEGRIVGHVQVKVASRVYAVPVRAVSLEGSDAREGFFMEDPEHFGILVDRDGTAEKVQSVIADASQEAAKVLSRKLLN